MNKLTKVGLTALGTTLIASSAFAADMSVSGGASISLQNVNSDTIQGSVSSVEGNGFSMGDSINFDASGEMDNGWSVAVNYEIDAGALDDHHIEIGMGDAGTIRFSGSGGTSALSAVDDVTPNAYEESWDVVTGATTPPNGVSGANIFKYTSPTVGGATFAMAYLNASDAVTDVSYVDWSIAVSPEALDGLTVGYASGDSEETTGTQIDESTMYAKYVYGSFTFGYQQSVYDHPTLASDQDMTAMGVSYAVNDDISVAYNQTTIESGSTTDKDQESSGISASYTLGSMSFSGAMNTVDNVGFNADRDSEGYEFTLAFAF